MMFLKLLLIFHLIGDFYFQTNKVNKNKTDNVRSLLFHVLIYTVTFVPIIFISTNILTVIIMLCVIFTTHLLIDYSAIKITNQNKTTKAFLIDQLSHVIVLIIIWFFLKETIIQTTNINNFLIRLGLTVSIEKVISVLLLILLIGKPTSILIEKVLNKGEDVEHENTNQGVLIGMLERFIIVLLGVMNLWSSIALVFTAKSIARFQQLEDKEFAQKYLIGTLLSLCITLTALLLFL